MCQITDLRAEVKPTVNTVSEVTKIAPLRPTNRFDQFSSTGGSTIRAGASRYDRYSLKKEPAASPKRNKAAGAEDWATVGSAVSQAWRNGCCQCMHVSGVCFGLVLSFGEPCADVHVGVFVAEKMEWSYAARSVVARKGSLTSIIGDQIQGTSRTCQATWQCIRYVGRRGTTAGTSGRADERTSTGTHSSCVDKEVECVSHHADTCSSILLDFRMITTQLMLMPMPMLMSLSVMMTLPPMRKPHRHQHRHPLQQH